MRRNICPYCGFSKSWILRREKRKCKKCRREWSQRKYPVSEIRSTEKEWQKCIDVFLRERTIHRIMQETKIPHCRVERMVLRLRKCMHENMPRAISGIVEMDETYIGGQRKNKRLHIRRIQAKNGHGTDKLPIMGLFSRFSGEVYVEVLERKLDIKKIFSIIAQKVGPTGTIYTDGFKMYRGLKQLGFVHEYVDHDGGELARGDIHTNNIEGFWGILKRKLSCIGGMRRTNLYLFVAEIVWKFNHRKETLEEQKNELLKLIGGRS